VQAQTGGHGGAHRAFEDLSRGTNSSDAIKAEGIEGSSYAKETPAELVNAGVCRERSFVSVAELCR